MNRALTIGLALVVLLGVAGGAAVIAFDDGPTADLVSDDDGSTTDGAGADESDGSGGSDGADSDGETSATPGTTADETPFDFDVDEIESCGNTCRDVTATLSNDGTRTVESVEVETKIYTDGDLVWEGTESIGTLEAGGSHSSTRRVDLSYRDAMKIQGNDGWITIETVVRFEDGKTVFTDERQVS